MPKLTDLSGEALQEELGARLRRRRVQEKLTQSDLADKAKVSRTTVTKIENGHNVGLAEFLRVADALGLMDDLDSLLSTPEATPLELLRGRNRQASRVRVRTTGGVRSGKTLRSAADDLTPAKGAPARKKAAAKKTAARKAGARTGLVSKGKFVWPEDR